MSRRRSSAESSALCSASAAVSSETNSAFIFSGLAMIMPRVASTAIRASATRACCATTSSRSAMSSSFVPLVPERNSSSRALRSLRCASRSRRCACAAAIDAASLSRSERSASIRRFTSSVCDSMASFRWSTSNWIGRTRAEGGVRGWVNSLGGGGGVGCDGDEACVRAPSSSPAPCTKRASRP